MFEWSILSILFSIPIFVCLFVWSSLSAMFSLYVFAWVIEFFISSVSMIFCQNLDFLLNFSSIVWLFHRFADFPPQAVKSSLCFYQLFVAYSKLLIILTLNHFNFSHGILSTSGSVTPAVEQSHLRKSHVVFFVCDCLYMCFYVMTCISESGYWFGFY